MYFFVYWLDVECVDWVVNFGFYVGICGLVWVYFNWRNDGGSVYPESSR